MFMAAGLRGASLQPGFSKRMNPFYGIIQRDEDVLGGGRERYVSQ